MSLRLASVLSLVISSLAACAHVEVRLEDFMVPDYGPRSALLPNGYTVENAVIHRAGRLVGITHAHHPSSTSLVIFCGGDRFHRALHGGQVLEVLARGADVVLFDYPGYGDSTGPLDPPTILDTALGVYDYVTALEESRGRTRIVYGFSLGGIVAAYLAGSRPVDGVILEATAPSVSRWATSRVPWLARPFVDVKVDPELAGIDAHAALRRFQGAVLILAGTADRTAPATLSVHLHRKLLADGVDSRLVQVKGAGHGDIYLTREFMPTYEAFLEAVRIEP